MTSHTLAHTPDVSVVVAVYNTMPYLTQCLTSLIGQTIGLERLEVVAVDDGSTDGSSEVLDRFAADHPETVRVIHQPNSGGPAQPSNRALEVARGRYVFFIGADDYLGDEALERLVDAADRWESDVVVAKLEGRGGRFVDQRLFKTNNPDITFLNSLLPYAVSNTKLFRRSLIEQHQIRYPEDLRIGSDQPFTIAAIVHAQKVSVLGDYTFYYGVRRDDSSNITYSARDLDRLECTIKIMDSVAELVGPGELRDAILDRHFNWELTKLLGSRFLTSSHQDQMHICAGIKSVADKYFTPQISRNIRVSRRVRIMLAAAGEVEALCAAITVVTAPGQVRAPLVFDRNRIFRAYPGFGTGLIDDDAYEAVKYPRLSEIIDRTELSTSWERDGGLSLAVHLPVAQRDGMGRVELITAPADTAPKPRKLRPKDATGSRVGHYPLTPTPEGSDLVVTLSRGDLLGALSSIRKQRANLLIRFTLGNSLLELPLPPPGPHTPAKWRRLLLPYVTSPSDAPGCLILRADRPRPVRLAGAVRRRIRKVFRRSPASPPGASGQRPRR